MPSMEFGATRLDRLSDALKLTKDQKKDVKAAMDDAQKEATPVHEQLIKGHLAIAEVIAAGKSQEEIDKAVHSQAELQTQMASIEMHAFAKAVVVLEADQKQNGIRMIFNMVRGAFDGKNWNLDQR
jgi:Spy/CpxP family protein refolding chaperone